MAIDLIFNEHEQKTTIIDKCEECDKHCDCEDCCEDYYNCQDHMEAYEDEYDWEGCGKTCLCCVGCERG